MSKRSTPRLKIQVRYSGRGKKKVALEIKIQRKQKHN